jgi:hypothetical protein
MHDLLQFLTPHERAELEKLATPPSDAGACVIVAKVGDDADALMREAEREYIKTNGYAPPIKFKVQMVAPPART